MISSQRNIPVAFERLMEAEEELEDIRAYDEVKEKVDAELKAGESVTLEAYKAKRNKKRRLEK